ncbi:GspH/FimT family pseudopilin [uncultured Aquimonas sp.]|jgi:type IV fimbrial biogenesis protein FimT|uniref:GspH/FimT family pseudopilin n=1 Tax=uncultured Aquimonas sp. TaxID=385483 RepID=UPI0026083D3A|nr:GspH/FimT family pseudopilin [uncultured Aquimonas sp.]
MRIGFAYRSIRGFSLIELLMTITVAGIVLGIALPSFRQMIERQGFIAAQHQLMGGFHHARTLAVTRGRPAAICPTSDGLSCRSGGVWDDGWLVFVDSNRNGARDAGEAIERVQRESSPRLRVRSSAQRPMAMFRPNGGSGASNLSLRICSEDGRLLGALVLNNTGRLRQARPESIGGGCG